MRRGTPGRGFDLRLEVAERGAPVLHDRLGEEADEPVAVAVGRAHELGAAALRRQDERVRGVHVLAAPALLALADGEREPARTLEPHDLDVGGLRLADEDLVGGVLRAERGRTTGERGHAELHVRVRPLGAVLDVGEGVEHPSGGAWMWSAQ